MLRRRLAPEPYAASATAGRSCALFGALLAVIAVLMGRGGAVDPRGALAVLGFGLLFALLAAALAVWSAGVIWRTGRRGTGRALAALVIAALVLAYPAWLAALAALRPTVADASTDAAAPPAFSSSPTALAARGGAVHEEPPAEAREAERRLYPNLQPVMLDVSVEEAYDLALKAVQGRGWRVIEAVPPRGKFGAGHIDAVAPTRVMALPDDVAIRIRPASGQARVDVRSASRFARTDAGENAARVQSLSDELEDAAS
ncbi:DUF1499 domain-containing protein [Lichenibacterium dinghuense]|uniref:DUF1499 domain-containing protein n=1 Tax=Lichenibacterium dinghuense TaxID=2895977 RepID=UPI001F392903|nr:DUF1499 domain-containing protein [Lichenibacterium sp. 6Y81]